MTDMAEVFEDGDPWIEVSVSLAMVTVAIVAWAVSFWHSLLATGGVGHGRDWGAVGGPLCDGRPATTGGRRTYLSGEMRGRIEAIIDEVRLATEDPYVEAMLDELERTVDNTGISPTDWTPSPQTTQDDWTPVD